MNLKILDELRAEVVSVIVSHQVSEMPVDLVDDLVHKLLLGCLEMILKES